MRATRKWLGEVTVRFLDDERAHLLCKAREHGLRGAAAVAWTKLKPEGRARVVAAHRRLNPEPATSTGAVTGRFPSPFPNLQEIVRKGNVRGVLSREQARTLFNSYRESDYLKALLSSATE